MGDGDSFLKLRKTHRTRRQVRKCGPREVGTQKLIPTPDFRISRGERRHGEALENEEKPGGGSWGVEIITGFQTESGQTYFSQKGHTSHMFCHIWFKQRTACHKCCHKCCHIFPWKLTMGNCGTSATTPFVLTPSGSCRDNQGNV